MTIRIVTDSTADLPPEIVAKLGITVVPLTVQFGQEAYRDGVDINPDDFYERLMSDSHLPTTSQPSVGSFLETYRPMVEAGDQVISLHVSSKVSGTYNSAIQASRELGGKDLIAVVDTLQVSMGLGLVVVQAAQAAQKHKEIAKIVETAYEAMNRVRFFGVVDTLDYLVKGGRIGKAQGFVGSILNLKPILTLLDGEVHPLERARSFPKAIERLVSLTEALDPIESIGVLYSTTPNEASNLAARLQTSLNKEVLVGRIGPVVGTYAGPGAICIGVLPSSEDSQNN